MKFQTQDRPAATFKVFAIPGMEEMDMNIRDMLSNMMPKRNRKRKLKVPDALKSLEQEEVEKLVDLDRVTPIALEMAQQRGIIFLDEMDKIAVSEGSYRGSGIVSRRDSAGPASDCRGNYGKHEVRAGEDGPHTLYRCRRFSPGQAV